MSAVLYLDGQCPHKLGIVEFLFIFLHVQHYSWCLWFRSLCLSLSYFHAFEIKDLHYELSGAQLVRFRCLHRLDSRIFVYIL